MSRVRGCDSSTRKLSAMRAGPAVSTKISSCVPTWLEIERKLLQMPGNHPSRLKFLDRVNYYGQGGELDGQGRVVLFASDLDRRWNDFPLHPSFVPFAMETLRHVAGADVLEAGGSDWSPLIAVAGSYLFGGLLSLQLALQAQGIGASPFLMSAVPYLVTLAVLVAVGRRRRQAMPEEDEASRSGSDHHHDGRCTEQPRRRRQDQRGSNRSERHVARRPHGQQKEAAGYARGDWRHHREDARRDGRIERGPATASHARRSVRISPSHRSTARR